MTCPHCAEAARCKGWRGRTVLGLLGPMRLSRHSYHCPHCGHGACPQDDRPGLRAHDLTPAADEVVCLTGVQASLAEAAERVLPRAAGLRAAEATVERATEAAGARAGAALAAGQAFGPKRCWEEVRGTLRGRNSPSCWPCPPSDRRDTILPAVPLRCRGWLPSNDRKMRVE